MTTRRIRPARWLTVAWALTGLTGASGAYAFDVNDFLPCEALDPNPQLAYGDYNDPAQAVRLHTVEFNHLNSDVLHLRKGETSTNLSQDLAFALRQFPNHPAALNAMGDWQLKHGVTDDPNANVWTAECYFQRAIAFRPNDPVVHLVYGIYLHKAHRLQDAERAYQSAEDSGAHSADYFYNRGLLEVDLGNLDKAEEYAQKAYAQGFPLPGLRDKLARARAGKRAPGAPSPPPQARAPQSPRG